MSINLGDFPEDFATLNIKFLTKSTGDIPTTLLGTPVVSVYKNNSVTQITAGITLTVDFDGVTGLNNVLIDLSASASYSNNSEYQIVITTGTVDGVSVVGDVVGTFSIDRVCGIENAKTIWDRALTGGTHNIATSAGRRLRTLQDFGVYEGGAVWIDTVNGTPGTTDFENGTVSNPVDSIADAKTIADSIGLKTFNVLSGSSITLTVATAFDTYKFTGSSYSINLNGQSIEGTVFIYANITGIGIATAVRPNFYECMFGAVTIPPAHIDKCGIGSASGQFTAGSAGEFMFDDCHSMVPGSGSPVFDFSGLGTVTGINNRGWKGGSTYILDSDCTLSHEVLAGGGTSITTGGGNIEVRGITRTLNVIMSAAETVQFVGITGPVALSGTTTATVNIYGITGDVTNTTSAAVISKRESVSINSIFDEPLTGGTHNESNSLGKRIRELQEFGTYEDNRIWIDTINGSAGSDDYEYGTILNKVDNVADSNTLGTSLGIEGRGVAPGSSITFAASQDAQDWKGVNWTLALGGQSISATHIFGANVSGVCTGANSPEFHECTIGNVTVPPCKFSSGCVIAGTITLPVGEVHIHHNSFEDTAVLDFGAAVADTTVHVTDFSGDLIVDNLGQNGTDELHIRGHGKVTLNASCIGGLIKWDGHLSITNNGTTSNIIADDITTAAAGLVTTVGVAGAGLTDLGGMSTGMKAEVLAETIKLLTTQMTESYAGDGIAPTLAQCLFSVMQQAGEFSISGDTITVKKLNGSTTAMTFTLDDETNPTSRTRAS